MLKIRGLMQADGRFFADNDALQANDTFLIRRFRPGRSGTLFSIADFRLLPEFAGTVQILDALRRSASVGMAAPARRQIKAPIGLERLQSDADLPAPGARRSIRTCPATRDVGVQLWGDVAGGIVHYVIGIFNGAPDTNQSTTPTSITRRT